MKMSYSFFKVVFKRNIIKSGKANYIHDDSNSIYCELSDEIKEYV